MEERIQEEKLNTQTGKKKKSRRNGFFFLSLLLTAMAMILLLIFYQSYMNSFREDKVQKVYDRYYVMIAPDRKSDFMQSVYKGAFERGEKDNIYIDLLGDDLPEDYTKYDLMRIAIDSGVDGIIIDADESEEMTGLLMEADLANIPVVTLLDDNTQATRCSFVGIGGYDVGREYGLQVSDIIKSLRREYFMTTEDAKEEDIAVIDVAVLVNSSEPSTSQNIIISGIKETIARTEQSGSKANLTLVSVDNSNAFSVEESIRDLFINGDVPGIIVCLDELTTTCVYQAVIDYNVVGEVSILGYYNSDTIINAIDRGAVYATIAIDTAQLGRYCVEALEEYNDMGATSQYFTADVTLINRNNVSSYVRKEEQDEQILESPSEN